MSTDDWYLTAIPHACTLSDDGTGDCICNTDYPDEPIRLVEDVPTGSYL